MDDSIGVSGAAGAARGLSRRLLIALYIVVTLLYWISLYLYMPTLPTYAQEKTGSLALVGVILAQFGLWQALSRFPVGIAADLLGRRKPFVILGLILSGLGAFWLGRAGDANNMILGRAITGLACSAWVPLTVIFGGLFRPEEAVRATSLLIFIASIGRVAATSVTGSLNEAGGYSVAFTLAAVAGVAAALLMAFIPEQRRPGKSLSARRVGKIVTRRDVLVPSLLNAVTQHANWAIPLGFVSILARNMGASNVGQSALMSINIAMIIVGSSAIAAINTRVRSRTMAAVSVVVLLGGLIAAGLAQTLPALFVAQAILGLSQGIGYPTMMAMSIERVQDADRATAMGLHQSVYAIGMFTGPWLAGLLSDRLGIQPMIFITAAGVAVLAALLLRLLPHVPRPQVLAAGAITRPTSPGQS